MDPAEIARLRTELAAARRKVRILERRNPPVNAAELAAAKRKVRSLLTGANRRGVAAQVNPQHPQNHQPPQQAQQAQPQQQQPQQAQQPPDCRAPKCHRIAARNRCQCPNAWLEFRSRNANERKRLGLPRISNAQHVAEYNQAKADGAFVVPAALQATNAPCKTNVAKLCVWMNKRTKGFENAPPFRATNYRSRKKRAADVEARTAYIQAVMRTRNVIQQDNTGYINNLAKLLAACKTGAFRPLFGTHSARLNQGNVLRALRIALKLRRIILRFTKVLGAGSYGTVLEAVTADNRKRAIKLAVLRTAEDVRLFEREYRVQHRLGAARNSFRSVRANETFRVVVRCQQSRQQPQQQDAVAFGMVEMDRIDGVLDTFLATERKRMNAKFGNAAVGAQERAALLRNYKTVLMDVASQIRALVENMQAAGFVHGDLHFGNIGFVLVKRGNSELRPRLKIIDFGRSFDDNRLDIPANNPGVRARAQRLLDWSVDSFLVWRGSLYHPDAMAHLYDDWTINKALHEAGFPETEFLKRFGGNVQGHPAGSGKLTLGAETVQNLDQALTIPLVDDIYRVIRAAEVQPGEALPMMFDLTMTEAEIENRLRAHDFDR